MYVTVSTLLTAVFAAQAALASPIRSRSPYAIKEEHFVPRGWSKVKRAEGNGRIQLQIGLKQSNMQGLIKDLHEGKTIALNPTLRCGTRYCRRGKN